MSNKSSDKTNMASSITIKEAFMMDPWKLLAMMDPEGAKIVNGLNEKQPSEGMGWILCSTGICRETYCNLASQFECAFHKGLCRGHAKLFIEGKTMEFVN